MFQSFAPIVITLHRGVRICVAPPLIQHQSCLDNKDQSVLQTLPTSLQGQDISEATRSYHEDSGGE